jgi:hypothetical protein
MADPEAKDRGVGLEARVAGRLRRRGRLVDDVLKRGQVAGLGERERELGQELRALTPVLGQE